MAQKQPTFLHRLRSKGPKPRRRTDGFYQTARWRKLRRYVLSRDPLCRDPFGEHAEWSEVVSATEVDHIVPRGVRPELELSLENLQALCKCCHGRKTKAESRGKCYGTRAQLRTPAMQAGLTTRAVTFR
jgi:5-methylcytosine-specific restriction endonuclease McrA